MPDPQTSSSLTHEAASKGGHRPFKNGSRYREDSSSSSEKSWRSSDGIGSTQSLSIELLAVRSQLKTAQSEIFSL